MSIPLAPRLPVTASRARLEDLTLTPDHTIRFPEIIFCPQTASRGIADHVGKTTSIIVVRD